MVICTLRELRGVAPSNFWMQTFFDNLTNVRARSERTEINLNSVECARPRTESTQ